MHATASAGHSRMQSPAEGGVTLHRRALIRRCARNPVMTSPISSLFLNGPTTLNRRGGWQDINTDDTYQRIAWDSPIARNPPRAEERKDRHVGSTRAFTGGTKRLIKRVVQSCNILIHLRGNGFATSLKDRIHYAPMMHTACTLPPRVSGS